jgi:cobaltochelatase CobT
MEHTMSPVNTLTQALPIVAAAYGRRFNIPVQVGGEQARTDGRIIQIPTIPETPDGKTLAFGYLAHEAGHIRFTDFDVDRHTTPLGRCIENILEDVRIEQAMIQQYPGTRTTLDAVVETLIAKGTLSPVRTTSTPAEILANGLLALARYHNRQQSALMPHAQTADQVMRQVLGSRFVHRLQGLMTEIPTLTNTAETIALAAKIVALMEQEAQPEQAPASGNTDGTAMKTSRGIGGPKPGSRRGHGAGGKPSRRPGSRFRVRSKATPEESTSEERRPRTQ